MNAILAAISTNVVDPSTSPLPTNTVEFWRWSIALATPVIVAGVRKWVPQVPKWVLPLSTPFVGLALGGVMNALAGWNLSWVSMCEAGALAVFVRETVNQAVTKQLQADDKPGTA